MAPFDIDPQYVETRPALPDDAEWRKALLKAAQEVRKGWCQNALADGRGGVCAYGALHVADGAGRDSSEIFDHQFSSEAYRTAFDRLAGHVGHIPDWNNAAGRSAEEVASAMEACARLP